jgi:hypothetical protein
MKDTSLMTTSATKARTIEMAGAEPAASAGGGSVAPGAPAASLPPRGTNPSLPPDADPEPLPIGIRAMVRLAPKT